MSSVTLFDTRASSESDAPRITIFLEHRDRVALRVSESGLEYFYFIVKNVIIQFQF